MVTSGTSGWPRYQADRLTTRHWLRARGPRRRGCSCFPWGARAPMRRADGGVFIYTGDRGGYFVRPIASVRGRWGGGSTLTSSSVPPTSPAGSGCAGSRTSTTSDAATPPFPSRSSASASPVVAATSGTGPTWPAGRGGTDAWRGRGSRTQMTPVTLEGARRGGNGPRSPEGREKGERRWPRRPSGTATGPSL